MITGATNQLIQELALRERKIFLTDLVRVEIDRFAVLSTTKSGLPNAYFPVGAVISCICVSGSSAVEVRGVGSEGMFGAHALHATEHPRFERVCQIGGEMLWMPGHTFVKHLASTAGLSDIVARYSVSVMTLVAQSVACNGLHTIAQRCARWLLVTSDRVGHAEYPLTHELLAQMLGVHRPGISLAVNRLQRIGIIRYVRGRVSILDKGRLETESCECYRIVVREDARLSRGRKQRR